MHLAKFFLCSNSDPPWWLAAIVHLHTREAFPFFFPPVMWGWQRNKEGAPRQIEVRLQRSLCNKWYYPYTPVGGAEGRGRSRARNRGCLLRCAHLCAVRGLSLCWDLNRSLPFIQWKLWLLVVGQNHVRCMLMLWGLSPETVNGCQLCFCHWLWISQFIWRAPKRLLMLLIGILFFYRFTVKKILRSESLCRQELSNRK